MMDRTGAEPMCEEGIIDGENEREMQLDTRPNGRDHNLQNPMHNNREGSSRSRTPRNAGRGSDGPPFRPRYLPCIRARRTDGRSRTSTASPDARGVGYRRSRPPPPVLPCCRSGTSSTGAVGSTWCPCLLGCSGPVGGGLAPVSFLCAVFAPRGGARPPAWDERRRVFAGVLREGPGSPRLKTWRRAGLAAKTGHCGRMYAKRVMTHGDGKTE